MKLKTFAIKFIDAKDCLVYETTMRFAYVEHACMYMRSLGNEIISIKEV